MLPYFKTFENWTAAAWSRMKSNTTPSGFCWCFHIPCIWAFFPPGEIRQNHSSNIINNIPASLPHATAAISKATHPKKNSTCKDWPRNIKQPWNIPRKRGNTMEKNMKPVCSGGFVSSQCFITIFFNDEVGKDYFSVEGFFSFLAEASNAVLCKIRSKHITKIAWRNLEKLSSPAVTFLLLS